PTEWLLSYYSTGTLIVDVKITGRIPERMCSLADCIAILRDDRSCKGVDGCIIYYLQRIFPIVVTIYINGQYRAEQLLTHGDVVGPAGLDYRRVDIIAFALVVRTAHDNLGV